MKKLLLILFPLISISQIDYETEIQPILDATCIECHQGSAAYFGGLSLTSYEELIEGGNTDGGIISTGLLEEYITTGYMPAYGAQNFLSQDDINLIVQWINEGASEGLTPCQQEVANATGSLGEFIPQCEEDGSYSPIQCWFSTGYCWCVDENGTEIPGTSIQSWSGTPDCSENEGCIDDDDTMQIGLNSIWTSDINGCSDGIAFLESVGYGCNTSLSTLNNPFWGSNANEFIYDICGCTCEDEILNLCEDLEACNYGEEGSCEYILDGECDCDGNSPEPGYDCNGNCLIDTDGDGICDADEISGCQDSLACNYNPNATDEDGSCEYADIGYDCNGNCLEDADNDGICDDCAFFIYGVVDCECEWLDPNTYTVFFTNVDEVNCEIWDDCYCECFNDTDGDGICDENEQEGCTDITACNYNSNVTDDDGSCAFPGNPCELDNGTMGVYNDLCECIEDISSINEYNSHKTLIKVVDVLGREVDKKNKNILLLYIYNDGSIEKKINK